MEPTLSVAIIEAIKLTIYSARWVGKSLSANYNLDENRITENITNHYSTISKWMVINNEQIFDLNSGISTHTIGLNISKVVGNNVIDSDKKLINYDHNILLQGPPGSGKTTTLKRLASFVVNDFDEDFEFTYPIYTNLRDLKYNSLAADICSTLGLIPEIEIISTKETKSITTTAYDKSKFELELVSKGTFIRTTEHQFNEESIFVIEYSSTKEVVEYKIGGVNILEYINILLNKAKVLLLIDGYDEIDNNIKEIILNEIEYLGKHNKNYKLIFSARNGEIIPSISGFEKFQINPLSSGQIGSIFQMHGLHEPSKELMEKPYFELADRPLFLLYIISFILRNEYIPYDNEELYENIIDLVTKTWDIHRSKNIYRSSEFGIAYNRKEKFLSELAYELTFNVVDSSFTRKEFKSTYEKICPKHKLPKNGVDQVISEIESHNGLIVKFFDTYAFCHICLQEHLCAIHIKHRPMSKNYYLFFNKFPEPLALATIYSHEAGPFAARLFFHTELETSIFFLPEMVHRYLQKILMENFEFPYSLELGLVFLKIYSDYRANSQILELSNKFIENKDLVLSIKSALEYYSVKKYDNHAICTRKGMNIRTDSEFSIEPDFEFIIGNELLKIVE